jgi:small-conductance mechanosensitive channel
MGPFQDYADYTFQFAYTTMFISAYPLATTMALVNNYVMMRVQAWFFCHLCKRPVPSGVNNIGSWFGILEIISYMAVVVSAGLVAFTGDMTQNFTWTSRVWMFFAMSGSIILVKLFVQAMYPRVDDEVHIQLARQKFIMSKLFDNVPDDDDSQLQADVRTMSKMKLEIRINDDDPC